MYYYYLLDMFARVPIVESSLNNIGDDYERNNYKRIKTYKTYYIN